VYTRWIYDIRTGATRDAPGALGVNDTGTTVGIRGAGKDASGKCDDFEVYLEQPDGRTQGLGNPVRGDYGTLDCYQQGHGVEILDEQGWPVVQWRSDSTRNPGGVFRWNGSGWDRLPPVGAFIAGARAVNDRGDLAGGGGSSAGGTIQHAALWRNGRMIEIGTFGGSVSYARGINDANQVVGYATMTFDGSDERPFLWSDGDLHELGLPAGYEIGEAYAIADNGDIGGEAFPPGIPGVHAILWSGGASFDLNDLIDTHDWMVTSVAGMTREGHIVAYAYNRAMQSHPVVLMRRGPPVPDRSWRGGGEVLAEGQNPIALAVDGMRVYWQQAGMWRPASRATWTLRSVPKMGGEVSVIGAGLGGSAGQMLSDGTSVWFERSSCLNPPDCTSFDLGIWQMPVLGGSAKRVAAGSSQFALQSGLLFSKAPAGSGRGAVYRTQLAGGTSAVIDTMELFRSYVATGLDTDATTVFYTWSAPGGTVNVRAQPLAGGATRDLFAGEPRFQGTRRLKVDGRFVYMQLGQEILRVPTTGGAVQQVVPPLTKNAYIQDMDAKGGRVWWTVPQSLDGQGCLWRANGDGSDATAVECGLWGYGGVRVDDSAVYVVRELQIVRFPK
jgi:probable HAF family extracellular repeat protein